MRCRGNDCNKEVIFAVNVDTGKNVILDASAPVYRVVKSEPNRQPVVERVWDHHVSHFCTCKNANAFSKKGKKEDGS